MGSASNGEATLTHPSARDTMQSAYSLASKTKHTKQYTTPCPTPLITHVSM